MLNWKSSHQASIPQSNKHNNNRFNKHIMHLPTTAQFTGLALLASSAWTSASVIPERRANTYMANAHAAITELQTFYNSPYPGYWTVGWWNSAACLSLLADLRSVDSSQFMKSLTDGANGVFKHTLNSQHRDSNGALAYDDFFDDEMWWVVALINTYDTTGDREFLIAANESFTAVVNNDKRSPCGGIANAYPQEQYLVQSSTIATALYVEAAAMLANRLPAKKAHFVNLAKTQWTWIKNNLLIDGIIQGDSLAGSACTNNHAFLTYIEGTAISGLVALYHATNDKTYLDTADTIATETMSGKYGGMVENGILTEYCDADLSCNQDEAQFKGLLMRGLHMLHSTKPAAANGGIPKFLYANADSIWAHSRSSNNLLGQKWAGPFAKGDSAALQLASHSSATMALVYAAMVQAGK